MLTILLAGEFQSLTHVVLATIGLAVEFPATTVVVLTSSIVMVIYVAETLTTKPGEDYWYSEVTEIISALVTILIVIPVFEIVKFFYNLLVSEEKKEE